jgi:hypothetical protein
MHCRPRACALWSRSTRWSLRIFRKPALISPLFGIPRFARGYYCLFHLSVNAAAHDEPLPSMPLLHLPFLDPSSKLPQYSNLHHQISQLCKHKKVSDAVITKNTRRRDACARETRLNSTCAIFNGSLVNGSVRDLRGSLTTRKIHVDDTEGNFIMFSQDGARLHCTPDDVPLQRAAAHGVSTEMHT